MYLFPEMTILPFESLNTVRGFASCLLGWPGLAALLPCWLARAGWHAGWLAGCRGGYLADRAGLGRWPWSWLAWAGWP